MKNMNLLKPELCELIIDDNVKVNANFDNVPNDINISFDGNKESVLVRLTAQNTLISHLFVSYQVPFNSGMKIMGDSLERGYGDLGWNKEYNKQRFWYIFLNDENKHELYCFGVKVQPHSIVSFKIINSLLRVDFNTQSGGSGVFLDGRTITLGNLIFKKYKYDNLFDACKSFLKELMGEVKKLEINHKVYGFNNWYYAYGKSSYKQIMDDTLLLEELTKGLENRPYMVIDDGWSIHPANGPWIINDKFKDMAKLASEIKKHNIHPGIWVRPLSHISNEFKDSRHPLNKDYLDPTTKEVKEYLYNLIKQIKDWGYELIKYDYISYDMFTNYGFQMDENLTPQGWKYKDNHFTNAEIIMDMYTIIRKAAGDALLIGCNTISHLIAGLAEINRIGDDTSGFEWERTIKYGLNSLAFRLIQNDVFYVIDADCVGIMNKIDWNLNKQWLDILAKSSSPLFVSCDPYLVTDEIKKDLKEAFKINEKQNNKCYPVDWLETELPTTWEIDDELVTYKWRK